MKNSFDELYFGSLMPVAELNEISNIYSVDLISTIDDAKERKLPKHEILQKLLQYKDVISDRWHHYEESNLQEIGIIYTNSDYEKVDASILYLDQTIQLFQNSYSLSSSSIKQLTLHTQEMQTVINSIIHQEMQSAQYERRTLLQTYDTTITTVLSILFIIFVGIVILTMTLFKCMQKYIYNFNQTNTKYKIACDEIDNLALKDNLTTLCNQRQFCMVFDRELKKARRNQSRTSFMLIDIDNFVNYRSYYGRIASKNLLVQIADILQKKLNRPGDYLFKFDNEKFAIFITDADEKVDNHFSKELCQEIEKQRIEHLESLAGIVTISIGLVSSTPDELLQDEVLLSRADINLNLAKNRGSNQVISSLY